VTVKNVPGMRNPFQGAPYLTLLEFESVTPADLRALAERVLADALDAGEIGDATLAESETQTRAFWALRENISAGHRPEGAQVNHDISTPVSQTPRFLAQAERALGKAIPGARIVAFGHMGDGNIHYTVMQPTGGAPEEFDAERASAIVNELATELGGSISAEHGIGVSRRSELPRYKDNIQLDVMRAVKSALDPNRIMNPRALI
jgi:FAD/FMN-containing dehydrogenase